MESSNVSKKLENAVVSYLRGVRNELQFFEQLTKLATEGGLGLSPEKATAMKSQIDSFRDRVLSQGKTIEEVVNEYLGKPQSPISNNQATPLRQDPSGKALRMTAEVEDVEIDVKSNHKEEPHRPEIKVASNLGKSADELRVDKEPFYTHVAGHRETLSNMKEIGASAQKLQLETANLQPTKTLAAPVLKLQTTNDKLQTEAAKPPVSYIINPEPKKKEPTITIRIPQELTAPNLQPTTEQTPTTKTQLPFVSAVSAPTPNPKSQSPIVPDLKSITYNLKPSLPISNPPSPISNLQPAPTPNSPILQVSNSLQSNPAISELSPVPNPKPITYNLKPSLPVSNDITDVQKRPVVQRVVPEQIKKIVDVEGALVVNARSLGQRPQDDVSKTATPQTQVIAAPAQEKKGFFARLFAKKPKIAKPVIPAVQAAQPSKSSSVESVKSVLPPLNQDYTMIPANGGEEKLMPAQTVPNYQRPKLEDVAYTPKLFSPVDELASLSVPDFRRLAKDPMAAAQKILDKLDLLAQESMQKRSQGITALKSSALYKEYSQIMGLSMAQGRPFVDVVSGQTNITMPEFNAIMDLNRRLKV